MANFLNYLINFVTIFALGYYLATTMQWYNYKIDRVIFKFAKWKWHIIYFILPLATYYIAGKFFWIYLVFGYLPALFVWNYRLDKKLVFTARIKRFFGLLLFFTLLGYFLNYHFKQQNGLLLPLILALLTSEILEIILFKKYKSDAKQRLLQVNPKIVAITGSYGKTSIKNFLYQLISDKLDTYKTPRSVNTLKGIVQDINTNLPLCDVYIVEAGAREKGDIKEIAEFIEPQYAIIGKIGPQHLEYFKTIENIRETKKEILLSPNLRRAITYDIKEINCIAIKDKIKNVQSSLDGVEWDLEYRNEVIHLKAPVLGSFNAINISLAFYMAIELKVKKEYLIRKVEKLRPIPHRLQKMRVEGKIIIDDSFNGNIEGMLEAINLVKQFKGRKVIVTPGIIEANDELNKKLAHAIEETFDMAIITGHSNRKILCENIQSINKVYLADKSRLEDILSKTTRPGDLVLFSNDAPSFL